MNMGGRVFVVTFLDYTNTHHQYNVHSGVAQLGGQALSRISGEFSTSRAGAFYLSSKLGNLNSTVFVSISLASFFWF